MKSWYQSKTVWLNVVSAILLVAALFLPGGEFASMVSKQVVEYIGVGVAIVNILLRVFFTSEPISQ
jgi:hypothetical protein